MLYKIRLLIIIFYNCISLISCNIYYINPLYKIFSHELNRNPYYALYDVNTENNSVVIDLENYTNNETYNELQNYSSM